MTPLYTLAESASGGGGDGTIAQISVLITALGAVVIGLRANKRDDGGGREIRKKFADLQADLLALKNWIFAQRSDLAGRGIELPDPPRLKSESWDEDDE